MSDQRISLDVSQKRLATVWLIGAGLLIVLLQVQSMRLIYGHKPEEAWAWLLPTFMPTLLLIVGAMVKKARQDSDQEVTVDHFMYSLSLYLSMAYLIMVLLTWFLSNFSTDPVDQLKLSNLWLSPVQGLVSLALGAFFVSQK
jgi:hypothetical protein